MAEFATMRSDGPGEGSQPENNSLGRLLALSDGVFAIAMTLLALDLRVPDLGDHPGDSELRHALVENATSYWTFLLTFYVVGIYWLRHRRLLRSVVISHQALVRDTMLLLLLVAAMPFLASLLARYGTTPIALAVYGAVNAVATLTVLALRHDVRRYDLADHHATSTEDYDQGWQSWYNLAVFLLCNPAGYIAGRHGAWGLALVAVPSLVLGARKLRGLRSRSRPDI